MNQIQVTAIMDEGNTRLSSRASTNKEAFHGLLSTLGGFDHCPHFEVNDYWYAAGKLACGAGTIGLAHAIYETLTEGITIEIRWLF